MDAQQPVNKAINTATLLLMLFAVGGMGYGLWPYLKSSFLAYVTASDPRPLVGAMFAFLMLAVIIGLGCEVLRRLLISEFAARPTELDRHTLD